MSIAHKNKKMMEKKRLIAFKFSDVAFTQLINVLNNTNNCWHFNIFEQDFFLKGYSAWQLTICFVIKKMGIF